ncbi:SPOR domain-containing protein [Magnetospirillum sp. SS-4]|uniref:SPOR domain-containing protein n=1 Tax=Magnetospirillum sp. SS-4 TaxID=2681465 RepID=UPI00137E3739|nr:SPOR domain-containing protein [Magnetospirillum sp. SS-4]CAA7616989.1 Periplasmic protein TonB [Magnetospirillum sp. SS-4]
MAKRPDDDYDRDIPDLPERYDFDADSRQAKAGHRLRGIVTITLAVVAVGAIVAAGLHFLGGRKGGGMGVPVIKADDRPIKVRPDDRGGMQVPNQDKLVYERMEQGGEAEPKVERLLPQAEVPKAPPRPAPVVEAPQRPTQPLPPKPGEPPPPKAAPAPKVAAQSMETPPPAPPAVAASAKPNPADQVITPAQVASAPPPPPVPAAPSPAKTATFGDYAVQLGAVRAQDLAEKEWLRIQKGNADLLGNLKPDIVKVELEGKGTYWRIRGVPLTEQAARQICAEMALRNQGCILVRR